MPAVSLDAIELAIFERLAALRPARFKSVDRWSGELTAQALAESAPGAAPLALLALEGEDPVRQRDVKTLALRTVQLVVRATWRVDLVVADGRGDRTAVRGAVGMPGVLALAGAVVKALNGLPVAGLLDNGRVQYAGLRPALLRRGALYAYTVRFVTDRVAEQHAVLDTSAALDEVRADVNARPAGDDAFPNPIVQTIADTSE